MKCTRTWLTMKIEKQFFEKVLVDSIPKKVNLYVYVSDMLSLDLGKDGGGCGSVVKPKGDKRCRLPQRPYIWETMHSKLNL